MATDRAVPSRARGSPPRPQRDRRDGARGARADRIAANAARDVRLPRALTAALFRDARLVRAGGLAEPAREEAPGDSLPRVAAAPAPAIPARLRGTARVLRHRRGMGPVQRARSSAQTVARGAR